MLAKIQKIFKDIKTTAELSMSYCEEGFFVAWVNAIWGYFAPCDCDYSHLAQ